LWILRARRIAALRMLNMVIWSSEQLADLSLPEYVRAT